MPRSYEEAWQEAVTLKATGEATRWPALFRPEDA